MAYDHKSVEARWQAFWKEKKTFRSERRPGREKYYVLDMFPYPSGSGLHVGHPEGYTATDIVARYRRMKGDDVLHPMGFDAFGLPAEQYAIQTGTHPRETTEKNIVRFRQQLSALGFAYDWDREVNTTTPDYVRWTQWIFLKLFERGLASQSEIPVNWCEALGTVLANEEVIDGRSERGNHPVERRPLRQWQLKITAYADRLASELEGLDWPETREKQRDWIGRSEGARVRFETETASGLVSIEVFTTRPDTLYGASYLVIAPDHPRADDLIVAEQREVAKTYQERAKRKSDLERTSAKEKTGVFTGSYAVHPLRGDKIPVYMADYVLGAYGTGAIMAVPAHDERDFEFAKTFGLPIVEVVSPDGALHDALDAPFVEDGVAVRSPLIDGQKTSDAKNTMIAHLEQKGLGVRQVNYKLRDWVFSRQRYWGEPIPIYFPVKTDGDPRQGAEYSIDYSTPIPLDESELPLELPELDDFRPGDPAGALVKALDWRFFQKDGKWYARETNTMPQWAGSCWYYLRYLDPRNEERAFSEEAYDAWMPVDLYVGGSEHAVLHLLYARFWHKVLYDAGIVKHAEPFSKLVHQGMILGMVYRYFVELAPDGSVRRAFPGTDTTIRPDAEGGGYSRDGVALEASYLVESQITLRDGKPTHPEYGVELLPVAEKMSKARGNVVNPDDVIAEFGADSLRLYEMFMGPLEQVKPWQTSGILGVRRFLDKVDALTQKARDVAPSEETLKLEHRTVKKVTQDLEGLRFNTCISTMMIFANHLASLAEVPQSSLRTLLLCLCPFAPHLAEEGAVRLALVEKRPLEEARAECLSDATWPSWDEAYCIDAVVTIPVQVNGKVRGRVTVPRESSQAEVQELALADAGVSQSIGDKAIKKVVYVDGKILNLIVG